MIANVVFAAMWCTGIALAVIGALAWDNLNHRTYTRQVELTRRDRWQ